MEINSEEIISFSSNFETLWGQLEKIAANRSCPLDEWMNWTVKSTVPPRSRLIHFLYVNRVNDTCLLELAKYVFDPLQWKQFDMDKKNVLVGDFLAVCKKFIYKISFEEKNGPQKNQGKIDGYKKNVFNLFTVLLGRDYFPDIDGEKLNLLEKLDLAKSWDVFNVAAGYVISAKEIQILKDEIRALPFSGRSSSL